MSGYKSLWHIEQAMIGAIEDEKQDPEDEHEIWGRDHVLVALVEYLAENSQDKAQILRILDAYKGEIRTVDAIQPKGLIIIA